MHHSSPSGFIDRHVGSIGRERVALLAEVGFRSLDELLDAVVPSEIRLDAPLDLPEPLSESEALAALRGVLSENKPLKSFIGQGYYGTIMPPAIQRNVLENPSWYTAYTPYQAEISQGRLEMLMNFQTMIASLTGLPVANASMLDEGTAAAEAVHVCLSAKPKTNAFFVADTCYPQTIDVIRTRCGTRGVELIVGDWKRLDPASISGLAGVLVQYPDNLGALEDYGKFFDAVHAAGALAVTAADLLALTLLREPGSFGADLCVGSTQRFGIPMGFGGPHAAFMACTEPLMRRLPGRFVGLSRDASGRPAYRLALQTREQHIRREKATSNICTAQVLMAVLATFYAVYHGPEGMKRIAERVHRRAACFARALEAAGWELLTKDFFDTVAVKAPGRADSLTAAALDAGCNIRRLNGDAVSLSFDETTTGDDVRLALSAFGAQPADSPPCCAPEAPFSPAFVRRTAFCTEKVFNSFHGETDFMRYVHRLESRDLALNEAMIPLGSCTMKLNAAAEMMPITWPETSSLHPFVPAAQSAGIRGMLDAIAARLAVVTGLSAVSLQPNSGAAGEYAGLLTIRRYQKAMGEGHRDVCLVPVSAHGTNPASSAMAGLRVVPVRCDEEGNIDLEDFRKQAETHRGTLAAVMLTYPSTHGVYEATVRSICGIVHDCGGQVYMDGANMNAQCGVTNPGTIGADVCHLNLHKTFALPHGGGGPGVGPVCVAAHLAPWLPGNVVTAPGREGAVASAQYGSASICAICWMYLALMGASGLRTATAMAILNANYIAKKLGGLYPVLYTGARGLVAHECILDVRGITHAAGVSVDDIAKRLMDYGFHAPTMSFPVPGTLMVEPTESEPKAELDRFVEAMTCIHRELTDIIEGRADREDNVLRNAPHTAEMVSADVWTHPYTRAEAAYPVPGLRVHKFWPYCARIDNTGGDRLFRPVCDTLAVREGAD